MAAGNTYTPIATTTLASAVASYTFSSIAATYTDLVLIVQSAATLGDLKLQFNSDTATNYSATYLGGDGTTAGSTRLATQANIQVDAYAAVTTTLGASIHILNIFNYANTTTYKTMISRGSTAAYGVDAVVGIWRATPAAINAIKLFPSTGNFSIGSTFSLYGITAA